MADVTVDITFTKVKYQTWLRSSLIGLSMTSKDGKPLIEANELGPDQENYLVNFMEEATLEVAKLFQSRQGDVNGVPFEYDGTDAIYRFNEETPVLPQADAIKSSLYKDVENALFTYVSFLWFQLKDNTEQAKYMIEKYQKLSDNINVHLYKLHD